MIGNIFKKIFGTKNDREVKRIKKIVNAINELEPDFEKLTDEQLKEKTVIFRERLAKGETLDDILVEAFATVREASKRTLGMRHYDVQLIGGIVLHEGKITEMKTGEGKTLVATCPVYLNALARKGVHVITVNDYLAARDREILSKLYGFLGLTSGVILNGISNADRKKAYNCDITYGTNSEFGFDYLRDNMVGSIDEKVQRKLNYCIVDEVDSILIDEARTPLIISGAAEDSTKWYQIFYQVVSMLDRSFESEKIKDIKLKKEIPFDQLGDYEVDEKAKNIVLTEKGIYTPLLLEKYTREEIDLLASKLVPERDGLFNYLGIHTLATRYLATDLDKRPYELPQERWMIIAMYLMQDEAEENRSERVLEAYWALSNLYMTVATPTMNNAGKSHGQLSSCFIDTVDDNLQSIYDAIG